LWKAWLRIRTEKSPTYSSLVIIYYGTAVYSSITHTNYELARAGGRAGDRNAGYEMTCFTLTHIDHFTSQRFVCVSHRNHFNQRPWHSALFLRIDGRRTVADMRNIRPPKTITPLAFTLYTYSPVIRHWRYTKPELRYVIATRFIDLSTSGFTATLYCKPETMGRAQGPGRVVSLQAT